MTIPTAPNLADCLKFMTKMSTHHNAPIKGY